MIRLFQNFNVNVQLFCVIYHAMILIKKCINTITAYKRYFARNKILTYFLKPFQWAIIHKAGDLNW